MLKQTASTEGIASKKSLELKKRYLLGESGQGIMKSDSTSMLDSKFKNFHSTISGCQKLLNPAPEISPAMQHFLKNTNIGDNKSSSQTENTTSKENLNLKEIKQEVNKNIEEKENVYDHIVNTKNELNKSDGPETPKSGKISDSKHAVLVENKLKELSPKHIETVDLVTPEKADAPTPVNEKPPKNQAFTKDVETPLKNKEEIIDLTGDSPASIRDLPLMVNKFEADNRASENGDAKNVAAKLVMSPERTKNAIDSMLKKSRSTDEDVGVQKPNTDQSRSPIHETSITVPKIPWTTKNNDVESDSLSSSSSSSVDDIPHYILDSTTSPDTQPGDRFVPRLEVRDTSGELMQIDSLMIIDGKYVGDPEDLKHMKMPENNGNRTVTKSNPETNVTSIQIEAKKTSTPTESRAPLVQRTPSYKYESVNRKPNLKFDTKNENKIDTLKNLPMILTKEEVKPAKPAALVFSDPKKPSDLSDNDKTPTAADPEPINRPDASVSDSETEMTGQVLTETELSDWTADDAVSENFVDIEFALNSNKGTIKRNKKKKRHSAITNQQHRNGPADNQITGCPIAKDLDFDGIEFMDTGSEDSCAETYSATNKAIKNRGYVQFVDTNPQHKPSFAYKRTGYGAPIEKPIKPASIDLSEGARSIEIPGVDYIEQGACILVNEMDLKTPMNEVPPMFIPTKLFEQHDSLNEIEDDSLVMVGSQGGNTTTEESDALTVVTSPMEPTPRNVESSSMNSSFDKMASSSSQKSSPSKKSSSHDEEIPTPTNEPSMKRKPSQEDLINDTSGRKDSDEMSYEDYVRKLQMKITQISNARDSIDVRKTKRKYSKGETSLEIQPQPSTVIDSNKSLSIYVNKPLEPVTVTEKLDLLTKERTKRKDLIHDLVMDKLQSKKLLNAEKRLNRSRNRNSIFSPSNATGFSPPVSTSMPHNPALCNVGASYRPAQSSDLFNSLKLIESERRNSLHISNAPNVPSRVTEPHFAGKHMHSFNAKERPRSDNLEGYPAFETPKLNKTQSFCVYANRNMPNHYLSNATPLQRQFAENVNSFSTPLASNRNLFDESVTQTEKLRQDARARAKLKTNQDLGLSPDEKIALLRKRYNLDLSNAAQAASGGAGAAASTSSATAADGTSMNKSDDMKVRERKMMASKSVNDIAASNTSADSGSSPKRQQKLTDSSSDPNLLDGKTPTSKRRHKDPERRKSIIQAVSDFFHKKKEKEPASPKEKSEGMFTRFRISPKSKSKVRIVACCW